MPTYSYKCHQCSHKEDITKCMGLSDDVEVCDTCGGVLHRDYASEAVQTHGARYNHEIHSDALAVTDDQRGEHQRLYPDVPLDRENRPVLGSFGQHEQYMESRGVVHGGGRKQII